MYVRRTCHTKACSCVCCPLTSLTSVSAPLAPLYGQPGGREVHFEALLGAVVSSGARTVRSEASDKYRTVTPLVLELLPRSCPVLHCIILIIATTLTFVRSRLGKPHTDQATRLFLAAVI
jgi:hypothetical protein